MFPVEAHWAKVEEVKVEAFGTPVTTTDFEFKQLTFQTPVTCSSAITRTACVLHTKVDDVALVAPRFDFQK